MSSHNRGKKYSARVNRPERHQVEMQFFALDEMVPKDHRSRIVWQYVSSLDLSPLYEKFTNEDRGVGRNGIAPEILLALWLMATIDSISSAREIARRCTTDVVYLWICGGVSVNHHTLSDFRSNNAEFFEELLVNTITAMMQQGFVTLETVAQDGMRVRASAGGSSFRREPTLKELHEGVKQHVKDLLEKGDDDPPGSGQHSAAGKRAVIEREARIRESLEQVQELHEQKEKRKKGDGKKARCSTTDPDARNMKMGDGGWRPAYNFQFVTDGKSRMIAGVDVTNSGSDRGKMGPMHNYIQERYGKVPKQELVDSAFATKDDVTQLEQAGTEVVSTIHGAAAMIKRGTDPHARQSTDTEEFFQFRQRMVDPEYQELYKQRPSIAEFPNAVCRNLGCRLLLVRGLKKVKSVALLYATTFNLMRMMNLGVFT